MLTHMSVSQLDMFFRCGEQWRRRYIEEDIMPPGIAARVGTGVHKAAETNYLHKMQTGLDMELDAVQDCAADAYDAALQGGVFFAPDEVAGAKKAMAEGRDNAVALAKVFREKLAPQVKPALVEEKIIFELPDVDLPIVAILDCFTEDKALRDLKTAGKKWTEDKAHTSPQAAIYREAVKHRTGAYPQRIAFDVLVNGKTPILQTLQTERDTSDTLVVVRKFQTMLAAIRAGIFHPAEQGSWGCSPKFCGYWHSCPYISAFQKNRRG